ncbi:MAG: outer membrane protein assembly factor BamD [Parachlamydiaceae bacterium]|nr:outer membrane protein assembly factor BamD [Parachlamydiaceae bacterium]
MKFTPLFLSFFLAFSSATQLQAAYTIKDGSLVNVDSAPYMSVEEHYNAAVDAYEAKDWLEASNQFYMVKAGFPNSTYSQESGFYLAVCYFNIGELDAANTTFSIYLQGKDHPRLFQDAIQYKFAIAERFRAGARCRLFGYKQLPKWSGGYELALTIYDEVVAALPCHDLAAEAFYSKALLLRSKREYRECIDCLQMAVRRFPKHELAPEYFLLINTCYLDQCRLEFQNPDILAFAEINCRRFQLQFPREERLAQAEAGIREIKEVYGWGLANTGLFYERIGKPRASILYYQNTVHQFPDTQSAELARRRLTILGGEIPQSATDCESIPAKEKSCVDSTDEIKAEDDSDKKIDWVP